MSKKRQGKETADLGSSTKLPYKYSQLSARKDIRITQNTSLPCMTLNTRLRELSHWLEWVSTFWLAGKDFQQTQQTRAEFWHDGSFRKEMLEEPVFCKSTFHQETRTATWALPQSAAGFVPRSMAAQLVNQSPLLELIVSAANWGSTAVRGLTAALAKQGQTAQ